jgi:LysR family transcriptional regulator, glycine cleavage system transcriptional activator
VGQQIRALEDALGVVLFRRTPKGLELTPEAIDGLSPLRDGFLKFEESVEAMQAGQSSKMLTIAAPRDVTALWLAPRLARIAADDPELRFTLIAADHPLDFTEANLDLAIRWGSGSDGLEGQQLGPDGLTLIAPEAGDGAFTIVWQLDTMTNDGRPVMRVGDAGLAMDAVRNGLGTAAVPTLLVTADMAQRGVRVTGTVAHGHAYWLVAPTPQWRQKKVKALVETLLA